MSIDREEKTIEEQETMEREAESTALIQITQLPEIMENLRVLRETWEKRAEEAESLVCTEESVQSLKDMRAQMRKEFEEADTQRKTVKEAYMVRWNEVEATWKECVADPFKRADAALKGEIGSFEAKLKEDCKRQLTEYYAELCEVSGVDFLSMEKAMEIGNIKINLSDAKARTPRKIMDQLAAVISKVGDGMDQIARMDEKDRNEIYVEFKRLLNVGAAVAAVQERRRKVQAMEQEARERAEAQQRMNEARAKAEAAAPVMAAAPAVAAPRPQEEPIFDEFSFTVFGCTRTQLIKIREFLKQEGISYE